MFINVECIRLYWRLAQEKSMSSLLRFVPKHHMSVLECKKKKITSELPVIQAAIVFLPKLIRQGKLVVYKHVLYKIGLPKHRYNAN